MCIVPAPAHYPPVWLCSNWMVKKNWSGLNVKPVDCLRIIELTFDLLGTSSYRTRLIKSVQHVNFRSGAGTSARGGCETCSGPDATVCRGSIWWWSASIRTLFTHHGSRLHGKHCCLNWLWNVCIFLITSWGWYFFTHSGLISFTFCLFSSPATFLSSEDGWGWRQCKGRR